MTNPQRWSSSTEREVKTMANTTTVGGSDKGYDMSLWYDSRPLKIGWFAMLAAVGSEVVFQRGLIVPF